MFVTKLYRLTDHRGLCLEVKPSGVKAWRYRFTLEGKASMFALGEYPAVSLAEARDRCEAARQLVKQGINPAQQRQNDRIKQASDAEITFEKVAREWLQTKDWEDITKNRRLDMLERVGLAHKALERTEALSGGQMQRVGIARALAQQPQVILADEPVASLDPKTARSVLQYLRDATRELGIAVVCNLHQVDYAREFGDRIVGLSQGRMVFDGVPAMLDEAALNAIYSGEPQPVGHAPEQGAALHLSSTAVGNWLPGAMSPATAAGGLQ